MAKFISTSGDLLFDDIEQLIFGDGLDAKIWWDGSELRLDSTISGVVPSQLYHLTTKYYVDTEIATATGTLTTDHGELIGLDDDDHTQYSLADGNRAFTGTVAGIDPTDSTHLTTKNYVDNVVQALDWQDSVIDFVPMASGVATTGNRYIASETSGSWTEDYIYEYTGTAWSGTAPNEGMAAWIELQDYLSVYNGTDWVRFGSTITHNYLNTLQGGSAAGDGERYHMTQTQHDALTDVGGPANATSQHIHDDRYYTETEVDNLITTATGTLEHDQLIGLGDDDHTQYMLTDASRGFTNTVSGVDPTNDYDLATKAYVDLGGVDALGKANIPNGNSYVDVVFSSAMPNTNYVINATLENTVDNPPSIYAFIVSNTTVSGFRTDFMGDMDSVNYYLNWSVLQY